jgi:WhiB family redox-sensing transcriptional regulator
VSDATLADIVERDRLAWFDDAACAQPGVREAIAAGKITFFPTRGQSAAPAKAICARCPVLDQCEEWSQAVEQRWLVGVWAGRSENQRRRDRKHRAAAA